MSWTMLERTRSIGARKRADAEIGITVRASGVALLRVSLLKAATPGWKAGILVDAAIGAGEHEGKLLLRPGPGASFAVYKHRKSASRLSLAVTLPAGTRAEKRALHFPCDMRCDGNDIVLTLPDWARPRAAPAPAAAAPVAPRAQGGVKSVTSAFFGDPPPGRSAAAQRARK